MLKLPGKEMNAVLGLCKEAVSPRPSLVFEDFGLGHELSRFVLERRRTFKGRCVETFRLLTLLSSRQLGAFRTNLCRHSAASESEKVVWKEVPRTQVRT
jgi:hypothetical protein